MKNLLLSSIIVVSIFSGTTCHNPGKENTCSKVSGESGKSVPPDSLRADSIQTDSSRALKKTGVPVLPKSSRTETTVRGTTSRTPGAGPNPAQNQRETDSIKNVKSKGKKQN